MRRLALVACLLLGLLAASAAPATAKPHPKRPAKVCKRAARASTVGRPTPILVHDAHTRVAVTRKRATIKRAARRRAARRRCAKAKRRAVAPKLPAAPAGDAPAQPGAPASPRAPAPEEPVPGAPSPVPEPEANPFAVQVNSGEFFLHLSKPEVRAGSVRVEFNNRSAEDPHDLHLARADGTGASYAFGELQSGGIEAKTLRLDAGTWRLFCALPEHAERGMSANLRVVGG
ncbi:MAG: hypothetical protein ABI611_01060 [Solirubrobacteraceae bacterium]